MISIIIPVYNVEKYLDRCIISILKQSFKNWELILLNDGSTDKSGEICDKYKRIDNRIRVIHKKNTGVSSTRNLGINLSKGEYITFVDSDDWIECDYLELMYKSIIEMNVDVIVTGCVYEDKNGVNNPFKKGEPIIYEKNEAKKEFLKQNKFIWTICDKLYKAELLKKVKLDTHLKIAEDMLLFWNILNSIERIGYVPLYKYHYDRVASKTMNSHFERKWFDSLYVKKLIYYDAKNISLEHKLLAKSIYVGELVGLSKKVLVYGKKYYLLRILQSKIRKNWIYGIIYPFSNVLTLKQRIGIFFFLLPLDLCKLFKKFIK